MRKIIILLLSLSVVSFAEAKIVKEKKTPSKKSKTERVLSYYQWRELSTKDRAKYIKGLQDISLHWENGQKFFSIHPDVNETTSNKWALLSEILFKTSNATDPTECDSLQFNYKPGEFCYSGTYFWNLNYCISSDRSAGQKALLCQDKFRVFVEDTRKNVTGSDLASFNKRVRPFWLNDGAMKVRAANGGGHADMPLAKAETPAEAEKIYNESVQASKEAACSTEAACAESDGEAMTEERRQAYRAEMNEKFAPGQQPCVVAGFVSVLNSKKKCVPVREQSMGKWKGSCGSSDTMCNPLVFGFETDGGPICVPLGMGVTALCHEQAEALGNTPAEIAKQVAGESGLEGLSGVTTEDFADAWQAQRVGMGNLCTEKTQSLLFFCRECTIMNARIREINKSASCADQCGRITQDGPCGKGGAAPAAGGETRQSGGTQ